MSEKIPVKDVSTEKIETVDLYAKRENIHPRSYQGFFKNIRLAGVAALFLLFFGTAWLNVDGRQAVLWDLPARQFHIFGATFQPQDFFLLSFLLIICAFGLFFITTFAGRVWCGYTCPQTVWTWIFMWAERVTEGERNARIKLDAAPMSTNKLLRRSAKHALWIGVSLITALTFVGYFTPIRGLLVDLATFNLNGWAAFWIFFFTAATYINAGWLREQVCFYMCPYARFQSVMFDKDTMVVTYDYHRGEDRGPRKKGVEPADLGLGDCIDCTMCVQVCPTGIDIRDGLQHECIQCAACIDACDDIMDKMGYERGLIRYTTEHNMAGQKTRILRPRLIGYGAALALMIGMFILTIGNMAQVNLDVQRDRNVLYREARGGAIENVYIIKVMNKGQETRTFNLAVEGHPELELILAADRLTVAPSSLLQVPVNVQLEPEFMQGTNMSITFIVTAADDDSVSATSESRFMGPTLR
ncbi:MAG TPA: cytochrome c oxidase accessory protein CcoG [Candidatus Pseudomonas excrementavium]|uniref:cytochrome c oxidase accessory protein CcoG n=1 Tax=Halopseudomonas bauzanensis TaxID=653930 RepID=UPI001C3B7995|nr:cytochrome c oxidase accessory protein CcoG [Halopseudomonas bauzanensis]HIZ49949.1 cytochrome c oxidase accessory protein CcoG [Candidatus Pseudomonas excrementavium]